MEKLIVICAMGLLFSGCSPKYFDLGESSNIWQHVDIDLNTDDMYQYALHLEPMYVFKGDKQAVALLSHESTKILENRIFHIDAGKNVLERDEQYCVNQNWHEIDVWVPMNAISGDSLVAGSSVYISSISGKTAGNNRKAKLGYTYTGKVHQVGGDHQMTQGLILVIIDQVYKVRSNGKKIKVKDVCDKESLCFVVRKQPDGTALTNISVAALIDMGFKKRADKSVIYEMEDIFGEDLEMKLQN